MAIFQFFLPPEKLIEVKKNSHAHQKNFMIFNHIFKKKIIKIQISFTT